MKPANNSAIRDRVTLIAQERRLADAEITAAMRSGSTLLNFGCCPGLSLSWLLLGDVRGRLRMAQWSSEADANSR